MIENNNIKFDWNDLTIVPNEISDIESRDEIDPYQNGKLPLFTAPMDTVVGPENAHHFDNNKVRICLPRNQEIQNPEHFQSFSLNQIIDKLNDNQKLPSKVLIDIANGHMKKLLDVSKEIKQNHDVELMIGNIANPKTFIKYAEIGVDWIRCGIGAGSACTTSANVAIHYPMASLISECGMMAKNFNTKIVADGGFKNFSDIIKALGVGADAVMIGGLFNKCLESISPCYIKSMYSYQKIDFENALKLFRNGETIYKYYRGMSTKEVQKSWKNGNLRTSEGITKYNKVETTLERWIQNFVDYLKSNMSYCGFRNLDEFIGNAEWVRITENAYKRFAK